MNQPPCHKRYRIPRCSYKICLSANMYTLFCTDRRVKRHLPKSPLEIYVQKKNQRKKNYVFSSWNTVQMQTQVMVYKIYIYVGICTKRFSYCIEGKNIVHTYVRLFKTKIGTTNRSNFLNKKIFSALINRCYF